MGKAQVEKLDEESVLEEKLAIICSLIVNKVEQK